MAFQMIHMEIAYRLLEQISQIENAAEFILGSVAPDSVHMNPHFEIGMKVQSHMFEGCGKWSDTQDYVRWRSNIENVLHKYTDTGKSTVYRDFVFGLCVHCLTDYWNDIKIWRNLQKEYIPPMEFTEFREAYYPEARGIDLWLHQNGKNTKSIMEMLDRSVAFDIVGLVNKDDIEKQKEHLLNVQYNVDTVDISKYRFLSADFLEDFIEFNVNDIKETLQQKMYASQHKG
ncbi:MAG: hypothetical protein K2H31_09515 [Lachnospiraceae bacterium]|nr:hypothetical protein [Lachnospiraceae bacterium]